MPASPSCSSSSTGAIETDIDLAKSRFLRCSISSGKFSGPFALAPLDETAGRHFPIKPLLYGTSCVERDGGCVGCCKDALGVPGEVGGRAKGAELIECAPRLCE